ncbi:hypothetical protein [Trichlorobacter lovleyi]|uniref:hypothetical protein n=1 Tax=Trichlorobacter lovleyi TaxID=313985 RepID=UPI0023F33040|nr:hypothetical protein [Trichlorobacter lovleyi]
MAGKDVMPETGYTIQPVDASNAAEVATVFRSVYGDGFPVPYVYHAALVMEEIRAGRLAASLAFDSKGNAIGYVSFFKCAPNPNLWEGGNLVVVPGGGKDELGWGLMQHYLQPGNLPGLQSDGIIGEAVCHHYFTQVGAVKLGFQECGLALDLLDGASFSEHRPETERVACVVQLYELSDPQGPCYLPEQYRAFLHGIYERLRPRILLPGTSPLPRHGETVATDHWFEEAGTWRFSVSAIGEDWGMFLDRILVKSRERKAVCLQLIVSTALPCISEAVAQLRQRGFFIGGLYPRWFGNDAVMLQQLFGKEPDYEGIKLYTGVARKMLHDIRSDREAVQRKGEQE